MAHAQRLTEDLKNANTRIEELEKALCDSQARTGGDGNHPLLQDEKKHVDREFPELETIYDDDDNLNEVAEGIGSLAIGLHGKARYHGETAGSEV